MEILGTLDTILTNPEASLLDAKQKVSERVHCRLAMNSLGKTLDKFLFWKGTVIRLL